MEFNSVAGIRPSNGGIHLGHFIGNIERVLFNNLSGTHYFLISDLHNLNLENDKVKHLRDMVCEIIACGIDPKKSFFVKQSQVKVELLPFILIIASQISKSRLERLPAIKNYLAKSENQFKLTEYFFPLLESLDILSLNAKYVFANYDNASLVELTREITRRINSICDTYFNVPELQTGRVSFLVGTDNRKMSKAKNNCIFISDNKSMLQKKIMGMYTDPKRINIYTQSDPSEYPVYIYHKLFNPDKDEVKQIEDGYRAGGIKDSDVKHRLYEVLWNFIEPIQQRAEELKSTPDFIDNVVADGTLKATIEIEKNTQKLYSAFKF